MTAPRVVDGERLADQGRRSGDWVAAAEWLASSLDAAEHLGGEYTSLDLTARTSRATHRAQLVDLVDGDEREPDLILLPDGTRLCWHLYGRVGHWAVERCGERCTYIN